MFIRRRAGKIARLNKECKAYASAVRAAGMQYDGHNGTEAFICWGKLKNTGPLLALDIVHDTHIRETESAVLPIFTNNSEVSND